MIIPKQVQKNMLSRLHSSHQGVDTTLRRARDSIYWHGMTNDITEMIDHCEACANQRPSQQIETLQSHGIPSTPWAKVGIGLFAHANETYLMIVDYYSDFFEFTMLVDQKSETTINACKEQFSRYGCLQMVHQMAGRNFISAEFEEFASTWEFHHSMSSPCYLQSNGKAEAAVKIAKSLLRKSEDPMKALLEWPNTPTTGLTSSPVQRLMQRRTRATVPQAERLLKPTVQSALQTMEGKTKNLRMRQHCYNRHARELTPIRNGTPVFVQSLKKYDPVKWSQGTIADKCSDRSYIIEIEGRLLRRNRRYLRNDHTTEATPIANDAVPTPSSPTDRERREVPLPRRASESEAEPTSPLKVGTPVTTRSGRVVKKALRFR